MEKTCKSCRYCHSLKHNLKRGISYRKSRCCTYLYDTAPLEGKQGDLIIQTKNDTPACEAYKER